MMVQKKQVEISSGSSVYYDQLPPLSSKYPWLVAQCLEGEEENSTGDHFFYNLNEPVSHYRCRIPELLGKRIRGCFHGWLVLSSHPDNIKWSLWNPSMSKIISLPPLILEDEDEDEDYQSIGQSCCLSAPPHDPNSVLLLTRTNYSTFVFYRLNCERKKLRKKLRWIEMSYSHQLTRITDDGSLLHILTYCNGKIYALNTDSYVTKFVIRVEIVVNDKEVVIKLVLFGSCPFYFFRRSEGLIHFLKGSGSELFYITIGFLEETKKTPGDVCLFKLDTATIKWGELESLRDWDMTYMNLEEMQPSDLDYGLALTKVMWEEMQDLKDAVFFVDLARDKSMFYNSAIASELGGYIHIRDKVDKVIYSYHVNDQTIVPSFMPSPLLPTSHVSMWECRLEYDNREPELTVDSKQKEDEMAVTLITHDGIEVSKSLLLDLPFDVFQRIMKFCVGVEYMNFRATCKSSHLALPLIKWRHETTLQSYSLPSPWLMVVEQNRGIITYTDPILGDNYFMENSHISIGDDAYCSRFGWLLFKTSTTCLKFFNPFTKDLIELPDPGFHIQILNFSAPPTSPDCMVAGLSPWNLYIHYVSGEARWRQFPIVCRPHPKYIRFPTFYGGNLYTLCKNGKLIVFKDLEKDISLKYTEAEPPRSCSGSPAEYYLMKCDQHLLLVVICGFGDPIEVFKLNDSTREWEKVNGLGKHMIYICNTTCLCIEAKTPELENKIFLPRLCSKNKKIVFYSLETRTFHTFNGTSVQEKLEDIFATTTHVYAQAWIEPIWSGSQCPVRCEEIEKHSE